MTSAHSKISTILYVSCPAFKRIPSPSAPAELAIVAPPIHEITVTLKPEIITGIDKGSTIFCKNFDN